MEAKAGHSYRSENSPAAVTGSARAGFDTSSACIPRIHASHLRKAYGSTCALLDANLTLRAGRVHALMGENGAGKSTLVKLLVGAERPDSGTIRLDGSALVLGSPAQAVRAGIVPIHQHFTLFPHLSVRENLSAFDLAAGRRLLSGSLMVSKEAGRQLLDQVGLSLNLERRVDTLSLAERQLLEIARGIGRDCRVLVLDEPTAALSPTETARLFVVIENLCAKGVAVLFISHKLEEIDQLADDVTVLRDGVTVMESVPLAQSSRGAIVAAMLGREFVPGQSLPSQPGAVVLEGTDITTRRGAAASNLSVRAGEIVGLVGLAGSGVLELAASLAGARRVDTGTLRLHGKPLCLGDRMTATRAGIGYVPADRHAEGLFLGLSAIRNASASILSSLSKGGMIVRAKEASTLGGWLKQLGLQPYSLTMPAGGFSGGNQQKLVVARNLALPNLAVIVALEPTRGVDIGAREAIHAELRSAAARGVAVVLASSDLEEISTLCHRCFVVRDHSVAETLPASSASELTARLSAPLAGLPS